ncbi:hypothetical protein [Enterococcus durans]|uniref:hypothetical protein n=1 Tax=Enterococcus durans TaxID=53345 RepID=UPI001C01C5D9|nr:hypothetical protein [Enterococcus durans]MBT9718237.1 hypothetical protein [Enterococcus durans]
MATNYWLLRAFPEQNNHYSIFKEEKVIGLGWSNLNDLTNNDLNDLGSLFKEKGYPAASPQSMGRRAGFFKRFIKEMKVGDYVLVPDGMGEISIGIVNSEYYYKKITKDLAHVRNITWVKIMNFQDFPPKIQQLLSNRLTMISLEKVSKELEILIKNDIQLTLQTSKKNTFNAAINNKNIRLELDDDVTKTELEFFIKSILESY